jgi:pSer/pThr/pTyr-binding forkhead associated (FHA) protein
MKAELIVHGVSAGDRPIPLPETIFLIGRDRQCHLRPHCDLVSKLHCAIAAWAGMVRVRDLRSKNGTFLNGRRIRGEMVVGDGDQLKVGTLTFSFRIRLADGTPVAAPIDQREVQWLLDAPPDEAVLSPSHQTQLHLADEAAGGDGADTVPAAGTKRKSKIVSAGRSLHDYFAQRRRS